MQHAKSLCPSDLASSTYRVPSPFFFLPTIFIFSTLHELFLRQYRLILHIYICERVGRANKMCFPPALRAFYNTKCQYELFYSSSNMKNQATVCPRPTKYNIAVHLPFGRLLNIGFTPKRTCHAKGDHLSLLLKKIHRR